MTKQTTTHRRMLCMCCLWSLRRWRFSEKWKHMGPIFRYVTHIIKRSVAKWKPVALQMYFIQSEKLTVNLRIRFPTFLFTLSNRKCRTIANITWKKLSKKPPPVCNKLENFGFWKQVLDCQPSPLKISIYSCDKQPESATRSKQLGLGQKQDINNNHMQFIAVCVTLVKVTLV